MVFPLQHSNLPPLAGADAPSIDRRRRNSRPQVNSLVKPTRGGTLASASQDQKIVYYNYAPNEDPFHISRPTTTPEPYENPLGNTDVTTYYNQRRGRFHQLKHRSQRTTANDTTTNLLNRPRTSPTPYDGSNAGPDEADEDDQQQHIRVDDEEGRAGQHTSALVNENERLKSEIKHLQESLVKGLRGQNKFVGGGQFRSTSKRLDDNKLPLGTCNQCKKTNNLIKKLRSEVRTTAEAIEKQLQARHASELSKLQMKYQSQIQQLKMTIEQETQLRNYDPTPSSNSKEEQLQQQYEQSLRDIKRLQLEKQQIEAKNATLQELVEQTHQDFNELKERNCYLEDEIPRLDAENQSSKSKLLRLQLELKEAKDMADFQQKQQNATIESSTVEHQNLQQNYKDLKTKFLQLQNQNQKLLRKTENQDSHVGQLEQSLEKKEREITQVGESMRTEAEQHQEQINSYQKQLEEAQEDKKRAREQHEKDIQSLKKQSQQASTDYDQLIQQLGKLQVQHDRACASAEKERNELDVTRQQSISLREQLYEEKKKSELLGNEQQKMIDKHQKALENAMQSMVRLCVVAPTVNVHLSRESPGDRVECQGKMPKSTIRKLVEKTILPKFAQIFVQPGESKSPTGGNLDEWLNSLLQEMQASIEQHLEQVFNN